MEGYTLVGEDGFFFVLGGELADGVALLVDLILAFSTSYKVC